MVYFTQPPEFNKMNYFHFHGVKKKKKTKQNTFYPDFIFYSLTVKCKVLVTTLFNVGLNFI
jgi:predicted nuclease of restriction endonuclease-like (RecB) superfamily